MKKKLLITEDNPTVANALRYIFTRENVEPELIDMASNGKEMLILLGKHEYKAITLDILMPIMSGIEILHQINKELHKKIVVFSGAVDSRLNEYPNIKAIFDKPTKHNELVNTVMELINA